MNEPTILNPWVVSLAPVAIGVVVSRLLAFTCCGGLVFLPAPWIGYIRWDVTYAMWLVLVAVALLVASVSWLVGGFLSSQSTEKNGLTGSSRRHTSVAVVVLLYAVLATQMESLVKEYMRRSIVFTGNDKIKDWTRPLIALPDSFGEVDTAAWARENHCRDFTDDPVAIQKLDEQHVPRGSLVEPPIFSPQQCNEILHFARDHLPDFAHSYYRLPPASHLVFPGDINQFSNQLQRFIPENPWNKYLPRVLSALLPNYNYKYGFEWDVRRDSRSMLRNQTDIQRMHTLYRQGLAPFLEILRQGMARHFKVHERQVVLGGDQGTALSSFSPPSIVIQLPSRFTQHYLNTHRDNLRSATKHITSMLQKAGESPCLGQIKTFGGTLALEVPQNGAGMLWWQYVSDKNNSNNKNQRMECFRTPYHPGTLATIPGEVIHGIGPCQYGGWMDQSRITIQMFMFQCVRERPEDLTWFVFN